MCLEYILENITNFLWKHLGTILASVIGGILTIIGVIFERRWHENKIKKQYFEALYDEIKLNINVASKTFNKIMQIQSEKYYTLWDRVPAVEHPYAPLYTQCYHSMRSSGYLVVLDNEIRSRLQNVYDIIYAYNRDRKYKLNHENVLKKIIDDLKYLEEQLPKNLTFLKKFR
ncbi:MAG: hypothetical protein ACTSVW_04760 [Candidatus Njordarchaeales archaeon]